MRAMLVGLVLLSMSAPAFAEGARKPAGVIQLEPIDIYARPQRPVAAIDIQKRRVTLGLATRPPSFVGKIAPSLRRAPL